MDKAINLLQKITTIIEPTNTAGGLYLGGYEGAKNREYLDQLNIKAILTVANGLNVQHNGLIIKQIPLFDIPSQDIIYAVHEAIGFLDACASNGISTLVHCRVGASRSASIVIGYLMKSKGWTYNEAFAYVSSRREIEPNSGFEQQLREWKIQPKL